MRIERVVDTHVHLINPQRLNYPWMVEAPSLNQYFAIAEYHEATAGLPITDMIFMEVTAAIDLNFAEVEWVESLFAEEPRLILDHLGKPDIKNREKNPWAEKMKALADCRNVHCKISGLMTEAALNEWSAEDYDFYLNHALDCFGVDRLIYGGDWPVCTLSGTYRDWFALCETFTFNREACRKRKRPVCGPATVTSTPHCRRAAVSR